MIWTFNRSRDALTFAGLLPEEHFSGGDWVGGINVKTTTDLFV